MKILVADSNELNQQSARRAFAGHELTVCTNGEDARRFVKAVRYDMVFLGLLPEESGFWLGITSDGRACNCGPRIISGGISLALERNMLWTQLTAVVLKDAEYRKLEEMEQMVFSRGLISERGIMAVFMRQSDDGEAVTDWQAAMVRLEIFRSQIMP